MKTTEVKASTACSPSKLPGLDWALNPYKGCQHACVYCYSPDILRLKAGEWGLSLEVKKNLPVLLAKERKKLRGVIGLGTVTDPYQPAEDDFMVSRFCLEQLLHSDTRVCIQTKSDLVTRDLDILAKLKDPEVGITVTTMDPETAKAIEPGAPEPARRIEALGRVSAAGIATWVFLGPVIPHVNDSYDSMKLVVAAAKSGGAGKVIYDHLRLKPMVQERMIKRLGYEKAHAIIKDSSEREWRERVSLDMEIICEDIGIPLEKAF